MHLNDGILIIDFGSQYTLLITRRIREARVYSEVWNPNDPRISELDDKSCRGIVLSGGPASVYTSDDSAIRDAITRLNVPILGVCYGMQLLADTFGGEVEPAEVREYGRASINHTASAFFSHVPDDTHVWMSHSDHVSKVPPEFAITATTENGTIAAMENADRKIWGVQFHPEVAHSEHGHLMLENFLNETGAPKTWDVGDLVDQFVAHAKEQIAPDVHVICGLSGGVDSAVVAAVLHRAVGDRLTCVMVDNGLLRQNEVDNVREIFEDHFGVKLVVEDAVDAFMDGLAGVDDPEEKRKVIGRLFIRAFENAAKEIDNVKWLGQGTLYPDVIESISVRGPSATIKSHHNVGGLPEDLGFKLVEPLRELFKDEVRILGRALGLPEKFVKRHPFPGPGLAVRILGSVDRDRCEIVRQADHIFIEALHEFGLYDQAWQAFAVLLPVKTVGVMGDNRTYEEVIALRAVTSVDGMTADRADLPLSFLGVVSDRIVNRVRGVNRVVYDVTSKPPGTIEWE